MRPAVVGLGLIGGSLAKTLLAQGYPVSGLDVDPQTVAAAAAAGVDVRASLAELCRTEPDLLILAVPLSVVDRTVAELADHLAPTTVVTDVGSVKAGVRRAVDAAGLGPRYVGTHPMAGTEHSGFGASTADLLTGAPWAVTVAPDTVVEPFLTVVGFIVDAFEAVAHPLTDATHDHATALISHVPHVLANELLAIVAEAPERHIALALAAGSFRDGTRVARTDEVHRTQAMVHTNAAAVAPALRAIARDLDMLASALERQADPGPFFDRAADLRTGWPTPEPADEQRVSLDEPGWRTTLTELGAAGAAISAVDAERRAVIVRHR